MAERVYQAWKGSNRFFFGGRLIFGPDVRSLLLTISLIVVPIVVFCVFVARNLLHKFSSDEAGYAVFVVAVVYTIVVLVLLLLTSARDPGIVPRASHPPPGFVDEGSVYAEVLGRQQRSLQFPRTREVMVNGMPVKVKYCDTCMLYRPPRCSHCSICDNCVERFDHHCPWVGQCIGLRNYPYFFMFISSSTLLCIYIFAMSALYIKFLMNGDYPTVLKAMKQSPVSVILMIYSFVCLWFVGGLTGFHLYLISINQSIMGRRSPLYSHSLPPVDHWPPKLASYSHLWSLRSSAGVCLKHTGGGSGFWSTGSGVLPFEAPFYDPKTTYENFRYRNGNRPNVYNRGCVNNFLEVFCARTPSRNKFRAFIEEEDEGPPPVARGSEADEGSMSHRRSKVEEDLEIGGDLLAISQRRNSEVDAETGGSKRALDDVGPQPELKRSNSGGSQDTPTHIYEAKLEKFGPWADIMSYESPK